METKDLMLDAAELLSSENGIEGRFLRAVIRGAGVNLASVSYHFGSTEAVVPAAFCRRVRPMNAEPLEILDEIEHGDVEGIVTALYAQVIRLAQSPVDVRRFTKLCSRFDSKPGESFESAFQEEYSNVCERFERTLQRVMPDVSLSDLRSRVHCAIGMMADTMLDSNRTRRWTDGACDPLDTDGTLEAMLRFVAAANESAFVARIQETTQAA